MTSWRQNPLQLFLEGLLVQPASCVTINGHKGFRGVSAFSRVCEEEIGFDYCSPRGCNRQSMKPYRIKRST